MSRLLLLEGFHLTLPAPEGLAAAQYEALRRILAAADFPSALRAAAIQVAAARPELARPHVRLSR
jgi:hypothetical protein